METKVTRKFLSIDDIQREYLPVSKKRIRMFVKKYLPAKVIGSRIFVERTALERLLVSPETNEFPHNVKPWWYASPPPISHTFCDIVQDKPHSRALPAMWLITLLGMIILNVLLVAFLFDGGKSRKSNTVMRNS